MAGNDALQGKLKEGIEAARRGDKINAQKLLRQVTDNDPKNEIAWMWMASVSETLQERRACLERVIRINPNNTRAQDALRELDNVLGVRPGAPARPRASGAPRPLPSSDGGRGMSMGLIVIGVLVIIALLSAVIFSTILSQQPTLPNEATQIAIQQQALITPSDLPTIDPADYTPTPFVGVLIDNPSFIPTRPAAFTPTFTPTATNTPEPSPTSYPLSAFSLLYSAYRPGDIQPGLYTSSGDASGDQQIGQAAEGFTDPAYDPAGQKVAFVRTVTYTNAEGTEVTAPELFIAPVNDTSAARQITTIGGGRVSSPTWAPDAVQLAFVSDSGGMENIYYITEDGNNLRLLTNNSEFPSRDPAWSPLGDVIAFTSGLANAPGSGLTEIFTMTPDGENITQLTDANNSSYQPAWSADGSKIVFASDRNGDGDIFIMDANGQGVFLLTPGDSDFEDRHPVFAPNMETVVFVSNRNGDSFQLYQVDTRGSLIEALNVLPYDIQKPVFRPEPLLRFR